MRVNREGIRDIRQLALSFSAELGAILWTL